MKQYTETLDGNYTEGGRTIPNDPANRDYQIMQAEVAAGDAEILPVDLDALKAEKYAENADYAEAWIEQAKLNPEQGVTYSHREVQKQENRRNNRGRGNDITKVSDADDYLFDWIDTVYDALDNADDVVEAADRPTLEAYDPATAVVWPVWVPYVAP